eukprot:scaffold185900_cov34-Prasinocladus_malaysianus.AAC.2
MSDYEKYALWPALLRLASLAPSSSKKAGKLWERHCRYPFYLSNIELCALILLSGQKHDLGALMLQSSWPWMHIATHAYSIEYVSGHSYYSQQGRHEPRHVMSVKYVCMARFQLRHH